MVAELLFDTFVMNQLNPVASSGRVSSVVSAGNRSISMELGDSLVLVHTIGSLASLFFVPL